MNLLLCNCNVMQKWLTLGLHEVKLIIIVCYQIVNDWISKREALDFFVFSELSEVVLVSFFLFFHICYW